MRDFAAKSLPAIAIQGWSERGLDRIKQHI